MKLTFVWLGIPKEWDYDAPDERSGDEVWSPVDQME